MIQELIQYQEIDRKLRKIEVALANSEERKAALDRKKYLTGVEDSAAMLEKKAEDLLGRYQKLKATYSGTLKTVEEYAKLSETLEQEDELEYFERKVGQVMDSLRAIENELLAVTKEMDETGKAFVDLRKRFSQAKEEFKAYRAKYEALKASRAPEIEAINAELKAAAKSVPPEFLEKYLRKRKDKIFPVLVPLNAESCGGCSMQISLNQMNKLKKEGYIECENCRRVIYLN